MRIAIPAIGRSMLATIALVALIGGLIARSYIGCATIEEGASGFEGVPANTTLVYDVLNGDLAEVRAMEVLIFHAPSTPERLRVGRVVGLPGDTVAIRNGEVLCNGSPLGEGVFTVPEREFLPEILVPRQSVMVLVDNLKSSRHDSRRLGPIPAQLVVGRARTLQ